MIIIKSTKLVETELPLFLFSDVAFVGQGLYYI